MFYISTDSTTIWLFITHVLFTYW